MAHSQNHLFFPNFNPHYEFPMHNEGLINFYILKATQKDVGQNSNEDIRSTCD